MKQVSWRDVIIISQEETSEVTADEMSQEVYSIEEQMHIDNSDKVGI